MSEHTLDADARRAAETAEAPAATPSAGPARRRPTRRSRSANVQTPNAAAQTTLEAPRPQPETPEAPQATEAPAPVAEPSAEAAPERTAGGRSRRSHGGTSRRGRNNRRPGAELVIPAASTKAAEQPTDTPPAGATDTPTPGTTAAAAQPNADEAPAAATEASVQPATVPVLSEPQAAETATPAQPAAAGQVPAATAAPQPGGRRYRFDRRPRAETTGYAPAEVRPERLSGLLVTPETQNGENENETAQADAEQITTQDRASEVLDELPSLTLAEALGLTDAQQNEAEAETPQATVTESRQDQAQAEATEHPTDETTESAQEEPTENELIADAAEAGSGSSRRRRRRRRATSPLGQTESAADEQDGEGRLGTAATREPEFYADTAAAHESENGYAATYADYGDPYAGYGQSTRERTRGRDRDRDDDRYEPEPQQAWDIADAQRQIQRPESPFSSPEPSFARGFGPQPSGVAGPARETYPRTGRTDRGTDAPPISANQLGNVITQAIARQTDRLLSELRHTQAPPSMTVMFPPFPSTERVGVFVDVANLLYSARSMHISIDFGRLLDFLRGNRRLVRAQAYAPTNPDPRAEQQFLSAVKGVGFRITTKNYKTFASGAKKADMDLDLCMDIVKMVDARAIDTLVLVSGDSDFLPLLEYCSDRGIRVEVAAFDDAAAMILRQSCDLFINLSLVDDIRV